MSLRITLLNTNGLRNEEKRRAIYNRYRQNCDILCIQETHCTEKDEKIWAAEWGGCAFFANGTSQSRGVAILINRKFMCNVINQRKDQEGRFIILDVEISNVKLTVTNIYAPNKDVPEFFSNLNNILRNHHEANKIIIGDFNLVMNVHLDRKGSTINNHKSLSVINSMIEEELLCEVWRDMNPDKKHFSWIKMGHVIQASRIDFALISEGLKNMVNNVIYFQGLMTDHSAYYISLDLCESKRGAGYWKFNTSLLKRTDFVSEMNSFLDAKLQECVDSNNIKDSWDNLKIHIAHFIQEYSKNLASDKKVIKAQLSEHISELEDRLELLNENEKNILIKSKADLNEMELDSARSLIFRSRAQWSCEAELNSRYFYNLEKSRAIARTCNKLLDAQGNEITNSETILEMQRQFYAELYKKDNKVKFETDFKPSITIFDSHDAKSEKPFSCSEIASAVLQLNNNKTPGPDGLGIDFYKVFWNKIRHIMCAVIDAVYKSEQMNVSSSQGVINLIPKKGRDTRLLKNLHPITLLNSDYKIIEKAIANRMIPALDDIINPDQTGFLPGRRISKNIRRIFDLLRYANKEKIEAIIISLDFQKAFDQISTEAVLGCLRLYRFSDYIINWTRILYDSFTARVQNNGNLSAPFPVERSVHQGAPNSCYYFILVAEMLAETLRSDKNIKGIKIRDILYFLSQYADDMDSALEANEENIAAFVKTLDWFEKISGLSVNYDKTNMYRIGSLKDSNAKFYTEKPLNWTSEGINVLGVDIVDDEEKAIVINYQKTLAKMDDVLTPWSKRSLSLEGKVNIVNTLVAPLFNYKMMVLPKVTPNIVKSVENKIEKFIWNGKKPKVSLKTLQLPRSKGGLKLFNIKNRDTSLKCSWLEIMSSDPHLTNIVYDALNVNFKDTLWLCNLAPADAKMIFGDSSRFWSDVLEAWCRINYQGVLKSWHPIWYNSCIRIQGKPFFWKKEFSAGLIEINQLYRDGHFISEGEVCRLYELSVLKFNMIKAAIRTAERKCGACLEDTTDPLIYTYAYEKKTVKKSNELLCEKMSASYKEKTKWEKLLVVLFSKDK